MPTGATLRVEGYREFLRAIDLADKQQKRDMRNVLRKVGDSVRDAARSHMAGKHAKTAAGYYTVVRQRGIAVEQTKRKTTGVHPEWGSWQMRHILLPSLYAHEDETRDAMERALDEMADRFNHGGTTFA
jgi:hypothetical protein